MSDFSYRLKEQKATIHRWQTRAAREIEYQKGDKALYVPTHAMGNESHRDCEKGVVSSSNESWVFVKYDCLACTTETGDEPYTAKATDRNDLRRR